jgi:phospholipase C
MWELLERREIKRLARSRSAVEQGPRPRPSLSAGIDLLPQIKHIVVLMMENHSYDNYLGMLQGRGEGFPLGADNEPEVSNNGSSGEVVRAFHLATTRQLTGVPSQSWHGSHMQWGEGKNDGFVTSAQAALEADPKRTAREYIGVEPALAGMGYWSQSDLPFYYGLARTSRWPTAGSARAWVPRSLTGVFSSRERRTALLTTRPTTCWTIRRPGPSSIC